MFFFVRLKEYSSAQVGRTVKTVTCEKCARAYQYQMTRRGLGAVTTVYGIGKEMAKDQASTSAAAHLEDLLAHSHDAVPCPECGWVQSYMVDSVRSRAYRWLSKCGWLLSVLTGVAALLGLAVALHSNSETVGDDQYMLLCALILAAVFIWMACIGGRAALARLTINPNRNYSKRGPQAPSAPAAATVPQRAISSFVPPAPPPPPAPVADAPTLPANPVIEADDSWLTVQIASATFPKCCCCCLKPTDSTHEFRCGRLAGCAVPTCPQCSQRVKNEQALTIVAGLIGGAFLAFALAGLAPRFDMKSAVRFACFIGSIGGAIAFWFSKRALPVRYNSFKSELNTVRVRFENPRYHRLVIDHANAPKAIADGMSHEQRPQAA